MNFFAVDKQYEELVVINKSKFITTLIPILSQQDALDKIKIINKKYSDATHNCYAFISNEIATEQRFSDDGEPQGTAGIPILEVLKKKRIFMTLAVVTRYFGGIKLGASGLISAYSSCVASAIDNSLLVEYKESNEILIETTYSIYKKIQEIIEANGQINDIVYEDGVLIKALIPKDLLNEVVDEIKELSLGQAIIEIKETKYNKFNR